MEAPQLVAGVRHIAAHRGVGPAGVAVAVEPQVQLHELRDLLRRVLVEGERLHPLGGELGADDVVVVERHTAVLVEPPCPGLPHVVHECGEAHDEVRGRERGRVVLVVRIVHRVCGFQPDGLVEDGQRVLVHVLVAVVLVLLIAQCGEFGEDAVADARVHEQFDACPRPQPGHQLGEFIADAFGGDDVDALAHAGHRLADLGGDGEVQLRGEAGAAHHAQRVVGEGVLRCAGRADDAGGEVREAAVRVDEHAAGEADRHRADREVAAHEVVVQGVAERHDGLPRVRVVLLRPVCGDLDETVALAQADRAEPLADVPVGVGPSLDDGQDVVGAGVRREVQIGHVAAQQRVADRAAHQRELIAARCEPLRQRVEDVGESVECLEHPRVRLCCVHAVSS